jgi:hypothetical protein
VLKMNLNFAQRFIPLLNDYLTVTDAKSLLIFILFFLALYFIGRGLLDIVKSIWLWIVMAMALFFYLNPPDDLIN